MLSSLCYKSRVHACITYWSLELIQSQADISWFNHRQILSDSYLQESPICTGRYYLIHTSRVSHIVYNMQQELHIFLYFWLLLMTKSYFNHILKYDFVPFGLTIIYAMSFFVPFGLTIKYTKGCKEIEMAIKSEIERMHVKKLKSRVPKSEDNFNCIT